MRRALLPLLLLAPPPWVGAAGTPGSEEEEVVRFDEQVGDSFVVRQSYSVPVVAGGRVTLSTAESADCSFQLCIKRDIDLDYDQCAHERARSRTQCTQRKPARS